MVDALKLYWHYIAISLRSQFQYRASLVLQTLGQILITAGEFLGLAALFHRFSSLRGWTLAEVGMFYGIIGVAFALAEAIPRGFDVFGRYIRMGEFDRVLLRPRSAAFQILGQEVQIMRIGRLSQAAVVLGVSAWKLGIGWSVAKLALLLAAIMGGACLFSGLFILQGTMCFWTIESIEIVNCTTYGGVEAAQFPMSIYRHGFRWFFTFVIPLATINYFPVHAILGRNDPLGSSVVFQWLSPLAGVVFLMFTLWVWGIGVRHYRSTGS
jgi:ABC-2 type transport system permease protein